jgi:myo-inositol catabolism protein IolC
MSKLVKGCSVSQVCPGPAPARSAWRIRVSKIGNLATVTADIPAFVLAIDHRNSLRHWYIALTGAAEADAAALSAGKVVVADGLLTALADPAYAGQPMLLVDEEYGQDAIARLRDAHAGVQIVIPAERSGKPEFIFEHGASFGEHIKQAAPDIVKALVRYNPSGDQERNARSRSRLIELARWLDDHGLPLMLELLVPPAPEAGQGYEKFDDEIRPALTVAAIKELSEAGLSPAYWKVEGQPSIAAFTSLAQAASGDGRFLVLGRGEDAVAVGNWVSMAAAADGFSGFAVGRTIWAQALGDWFTGRTGRADAVAVIAASYLHFTAIYLKNLDEADIQALGLEAGQLRRIGIFAGNQRVYRGQVTDGRESHPAELGAVGKHHYSF